MRRSTSGGGGEGAPHQASPRGDVIGDADARWDTLRRISLKLCSLPFLRRERESDLLGVAAAA